MENQRNIHLNIPTDIDWYLLALSIRDIGFVRYAEQRNIIIESQYTAYVCRNVSAVLYLRSHQNILCILK